MGLIASISSALGRRAASSGAVGPHAMALSKFVRQATRRWEAAKTDHLNQKHWLDATDRSLNQDLSGNLQVLRNRCHLEAARNPYVEGVMQTHAMDIVGERGPTLQVQSEDDEYNAALEAVWARWWEMPDINGQWSGADILKQDIRSCWLNGEMLHQIVVDASIADGPQLRINMIDPRRLATPMDHYGQQDVTLGIKRTPTGKPITYFIQTANDNEVGYQRFNDTQPIPAEDIIHGFELTEPGQARGIPWLACALQQVADLRDYDLQTLDAARVATYFAAIMYTDSPDAQFQAVNEQAEIQRRMIMTAPPGYKVTQLSPQHPTSQFVEYRAAKLAALGRCRNMPLMMVTLDSSEHNYSSARFDGQIYQRGNSATQGWLTRLLLNRMLTLLAREAELMRLTPIRPEKISYLWTWPVPPHVDPYKEAMAEKTRLENRTTTRTASCASSGLDYESIASQNDRELREENRVAVERIVDLQKQIDAANSATPGLNLHWSHVLAIGGATTAPGGFLQGTSPPPPPLDPNADDAAGDGIASKSSANKAAEPNRIAPYLNGNGAHR